MATVNVLHSLLLLAALSWRPCRDAHERALRMLAVTYLAGCTWRCTFPVLWETSPHGCLFIVDRLGLIGGEMLDQCVSHCAECSLAVMLAIKTGRALQLHGSSIGAAVASRSFWLIVGLARLCCWYKHGMGPTLTWWDQG